MSPSATERAPGLTADRQAALATARERWGEVARATGPADRAAAEVALHELYELAGYPAPARVLWFSSPLEGALAAYLASQETPSVRGRVRALLAPSAIARCEVAFDASALDVIRRALGEGYGRAVRQLLRDEIAAAPRFTAGDRVYRELRASGALPGLKAPAPPPWELVWPQVVACARTGGTGHLEAGAVGLLELAQALKLPGLAFPGLGPLASLTRACGWWWPLRDACVLTELPAKARTDERGRLHADTVPALEYPDGFGLHAIGGVPVSPEIIRERTLRLVDSVLSEPNAEIRRVMLDRLDLERLVRLGCARRLDRDAGRALYEIRLPARSPLVVVQVTCPSTGNVYLLGVPPAMRRCHDAVAWTFGMRPEEYSTLQET